MKRPDARDLYPWVIVHPQTYEIIVKGRFESLVGETSGHLMTLSNYKQFFEEKKNGSIQRKHS
jgi:hypothetical protein